MASHIDDVGEESTEDYASESSGDELAIHLDNDGSLELYDSEDESAAFFGRTNDDEGCEGNESDGYDSSIEDDSIAGVDPVVNFTGPFAFQKLPAEIRTLTYHQLKDFEKRANKGKCLTVTVRHFKHWTAGMRKVYRKDPYEKSPGPCTKRKCNLHYQHSSTPTMYGFVLTCRQFRDEAIAFLYQDVNFVLDYPCFGHGKSRETPIFPKDFQWNMIRSVQITVDSLAYYPPYVNNVMEKLAWGIHLDCLTMKFDDTEMRYQLTHDSEGDEMAAGAMELEDDLISLWPKVEISGSVRIYGNQGQGRRLKKAELQRQARMGKQA